MAQIILISAMRCNFNKEIRMEKMNVKPATGKLGVLCVGLGAVTSTFMTGVLMARKGLAKPVGSMTQYDKMRVGRGENKKVFALWRNRSIGNFGRHCFWCMGCLSC